MTESQLTEIPLLFIFLIVLLYIKDSHEKKVLDAIMLASYEFVTWRYENPHIYLGLSDQGKKLLTRLIICHDEFHAMFPFVDGKEHREYLMSLFDELPPKPHKPNPKQKTESLQKRGDFFL